jgi:hypothetical protein
MPAEDHHKQQQHQQLLTAKIEEDKFHESIASKIQQQPTAGNCGRLASEFKISSNNTFIIGNNNYYYDPAAAHQAQQQATQFAVRV